MASIRKIDIYRNIKINTDMILINQGLCYMVFNISVFVSALRDSDLSRNKNIVEIGK